MATGSTGWLSDLTANRYIKTYFKDWIDVNGDITCRNNLIFKDGSIQNSASQGDTWISNNIVNSPPQIVFNTNYPSSSSMIYVSWSYPTQINVGMLNLYLPLINSFSSSLTCSINGSLTTSNIINNDTSSNTIKYNGPTLQTNYITGIILTNINVNTGYQSITFPNESSPRHCYVVYNSSFANLIDDPNNKITCWYSNYQSVNLPSSTHFNIFLQAGSPSAPSVPTFGSQTADNNGISLIASTTTPQYSDSLNLNNVPSIQRYRMNKSGNTGSSPRYYGFINDTSSIFYSNGNSLNIQLSNLFPDTSYNITCQAQNNSTNQNYGQTSSIATLNTTYLNPPSTFGSLNFSSSGISAKLVSNNSSVNNVIFSNPSPLTSDQIIAPIHYSSTRGSTSNGLYKINVDISRGGTNIETGSNLKYNGFPITTPLSFSSANISINTNAPTDFYNNSSTSPLAGYYLTCSNSITLKNPLFVASNNQSIVSLTHTQYQANGTTINNSQNSSYSFYYDAYSGNPTITSITIGLRSITSQQISGVYIINSNIGLNVSTILNNLGTYFYNKDHILTYDNSMGQQETDLSNFTVASKNATSILYPATIINNASVYQNYQTFSIGTSLNTTAYSCANSSTSGSSNTLNIILDYPSLSLNAPSSGSSLVGINNNNNIGWRVSSLTATTIGTSSYVSALPPASVNSALYDNTQLLTANQDLQLFNGKYRSKGTNSQGYLNYTTYYKDTTTFNTANYASILASGYRYCTFAWKVSVNASNYTKIQFNINGINQNINNYDALPTIGSTRLYLYYRIEDALNYTSAFFTGAYRNTTWIDINNNNNALTGGNYYINTAIVDGKDTASGKNNTFNNGTYTVNGLTQSFNVGASDTIYIYFRMAVPMNEDFEFQNVRATLI